METKETNFCSSLSGCIQDGIDPVAVHYGCLGLWLKSGIFAGLSLRYHTRYSRGQLTFLRAGRARRFVLIQLDRRGHGDIPMMSQWWTCPMVLGAHFLMNQWDIAPDHDYVWQILVVRSELMSELDRKHRHKVYQGLSIGGESVNGHAHQCKSMHIVPKESPGRWMENWSSVLQCFIPHKCGSH